MDNFDLKKYLAEGKLHKPTLNEFIGGELEKRNEVLYDKLVPGSGAAGTIEGEMLRAMNRLIYRYYNDGDKYFEGYGTETAGPAHSFLVNADHPQRSAMIKLFTEPRGDSEYEQILKDALDVILDHIESRQGNYTESSEDMFDYESEFEDEEEDAWDSEDEWYDGEDEDEDY